MRLGPLEILYLPLLTDAYQSFFNFILKELGVKDVKIQELFGVDAESLMVLP